MPYLRSQISFITSQPEVECIALRSYNIDNMMNNLQEKDDVY